MSSGRALSPSDLQQINEKSMEACTAKVRPDDQTADDSVVVPGLARALQTVETLTVNQTSYTAA